jgi:hypothetical protein
MKTGFRNTSASVFSEAEDSGGRNNHRGTVLQANDGAEMDEVSPRIIRWSSAQVRTRTHSQIPLPRITH